MRKEIQIHDTQFIEDVCEAFWDRMLPHLGDENPLWKPLATALAMSIKDAILKAVARENSA